MIGDTLFNIAHAAVAEFDRVFIYDFMELVVCWEASAEGCLVIPERTGNGRKRPEMTQNDRKRHEGIWLFISMCV